MELARMLQVPYQRILRASIRGRIKQDRRGAYDVEEARKTIIEHESLAPGGSTNKFSTKWDMRLRKAKALMAELELGLLKQELVVKKDVVNEMISRELELKDALVRRPPPSRSIRPR